jgi:hypothetical protein
LTWTPEPLCSTRTSFAERAPVSSIWAFSMSVTGSATSRRSCSRRFAVSTVTLVLSCATPMTRSSDFASPSARTAASSAASAKPGKVDRTS